MSNLHRAARIIYVDDSGAETTGFATYSWVSVMLDDWREALSDILAWRQDLTSTYSIPKNHELHAVKFANGRGNPSLDAEWNRRKAHRSAVLDESFERFASWEWLSVGSVYSKTALRRDHFAKERARVYSQLVHHLDDRLASADEWGTLVMDGDGTDTSYIAAHRELPIGTRSLLEDPGFQHSSRSQWVQIADLVAYAAYQSVAQVEEKQFSWGWYGTLEGRGAELLEV